MLRKELLTSTYIIAMDPGIKINKSNMSKIKNLLN